MRRIDAPNACRAISVPIAAVLASSRKSRGGVAPEDGVLRRGLETGGAHDVERSGITEPERVIAAEHDPVLADGS